MCGVYGFWLTRDSGVQRTTCNRASCYSIRIAHDMCERSEWDARSSCVDGLYVLPSCGVFMALIQINIYQWVNESQRLILCTQPFKYAIWVCFSSLNQRDYTCRRYLRWWRAYKEAIHTHISPRHIFFFAYFSSSIPAAQLDHMSAQLRIALK